VEYIVTAAFPFPEVLPIEVPVELLVEVPVEGLVIPVLPHVYAERIEPVRRPDH
jgi:hypothetical protein